MSAAPRPSRSHGAPQRRVQLARHGEHSTARHGMARSGSTRSNPIQSGSTSVQYRSSAAPLAAVRRRPPGPSAWRLPCSRRTKGLHHAGPWCHAVIDDAQVIRHISHIVSRQPVRTRGRTAFHTGRRRQQTDRTGQDRIGQDERGIIGQDKTGQERIEQGMGGEGRAGQAEQGRAG